MEKYDLLAEKLLCEMVSIDTVNGNEAMLAESIANTLSSYGFHTVIDSVAKNRSNVCATFGSSENRVIFTGHTDVVPTGENWQTDPFVATKIGDRFYGRGCCDMKGGIACMMAAAIKAVEENIIKDCELRLVFVADEEVNGIGTKDYVAKETPTAKTITIIGEPTELNLCIAHRGVTRFKVKLYGKQCHSGTPEKGVNAIYLAARFLLAIEKLNQAKQSVRCGILPPANITATIAHSGIKENAVPGEAEIILDCRSTLSDTPKSLKKDITDILEKLFAKTDVTYDVTEFLTVLPSYTKEDSRVCSLVGKAYRNAFSKKETITYFEGCCDMSYFKQAGYQDILLCGPGSMQQAHTVNESIERSELHKAVKLYYEIIKQAQCLS